LTCFWYLKLVDFEARLGRPFIHAAYIDQLIALRDRLKVALSGTPAEGEPSASEMADQIKAVKASHTVEAAPTRVKPQKPRIERTRPPPQPEPEPIIEETIPEPVRFQERVTRAEVAIF